MLPGCYLSTAYNFKLFLCNLLLSKNEHHSVETVMSGFLSEEKIFLNQYLAWADTMKLLLYAENWLDFCFCEKINFKAAVLLKQSHRKLRLFLPLHEITISPSYLLIQNLVLGYIHLYPAWKIMGQNSDLKKQFQNMTTMFSAGTFWVPCSRFGC